MKKISLIIGLLLFTSCKTSKSNCDKYSSYEIRIEHCHIEKENYCFYSVDTIFFKK